MGDKVGHGYLGSNKDRKGEKHPNYKGRVTVDRDIPAGTTLWIAGWDKQNDKGRYISLNVEVSQEKGDGKPPRTQGQARIPLARTDDMDDFVPF